MFVSEVQSFLPGSQTYLPGFHFKPKYIKYYWETQRKKSVHQKNSQCSSLIQNRRGGVEGPQKRGKRRWITGGAEQFTTNNCENNGLQRGSTVYWKKLPKSFQTYILVLYQQGGKNTQEPTAPKQKDLVSKQINCFQAYEPNCYCYF